MTLAAAAFLLPAWHGEERGGDDRSGVGAGGDSGRVGAGAATGGGSALDGCRREIGRAHV